MDVLFTADQPALMLHGKQPSWKIIGRLMYNRVGTLVPGDSPVHAMADFRGGPHQLAVPFGAAAQREALAAAKLAGVDPQSELVFKNVGIEEILGLAKAGSTGGRWGETDAVAVWDPALTQLEAGGARVVAEGRVTAVIVMNTSYIEAHSGADQRFMRAMGAAWDTWRADRSGPDAWYQELAHLQFPADVLAKAASIEPNLDPTQSVRLTLSNDDVAGLQKVADFMQGAGMLANPLDVRTALTPGASAP